ncbi:TetR/AcrR family transcriptional regulator [Paenibacillus sp. DXFW5]|uniref:TetR/AcrR family transcriptional regulator n=1 Tax=Paenibacillus rhizolycopersici TaxID=2780073 RepID=A0ABS2H5N8_9BACL|nr:TetR/AcrR family transcriptional regulator [Paenibacillus rhizolycopersici]MBM6996106.1 TetR/AcrR family transcriptional regulator [Paenibacillus rhizolycopersici]
MNDNKKLHILTVALDVLFKYGYKRVSMNELAEAAGISRAGLYLYFKNKEEVFNATILHYGDLLIEEIVGGISSKKTPEDKILYAFEVWSINNFDQSLNSPEVKEITDSSYTFAQEALHSSYKKLEVVLISILESQTKSTSSINSLSPEKLAHLLTSASRGFKMVARDSSELREMIKDLLRIILNN